MTRLNPFPSLAAALFALTGLAACSVKDPLFCDATHPCSDPAIPYCDTTGAYAPEHIANTCIASPFDAAPLCTPGAFDRCDGDTLYRCDATGYAYEPVACELGCSATAGACRLCSPSTTACTNGTVATCDANGDVVSSKACPLGCFQDQPRCTDVDPSNGLAPYLDLTTTVGVDLDLTDGAIIDTSTGAIKNGDGSSVVVTNTLIAAPPNGVPVRVFIVKSAHLRDLTFAFPLQEAAIPALALVSDGTITIDGTIDLTGAQVRATPGSLITGPCTGSLGAVYHSQVTGEEFVDGSGGAGYATTGGKGGTINGGPGGAGGQAFTNPLLVPLRGGCRSQHVDSLGGGAIQLVSRQRIELHPGATVDASGHGGLGDTEVTPGGASGGGILLEAPEVTLDKAAVVVANGGGGAAFPNPGTTGQRSTTPAPGGACNNSLHCAAGGNGGAAGGAPTNGGSIASYPTDEHRAYAGGGGGSVGYIRVNTGSGTYTKASDAIESPVPSTGTLKTR